MNWINISKQITFTLEELWHKEKTKEFMFKFVHFILCICPKVSCNFSGTGTPPPQADSVASADPRKNI